MARDWAGWHTAYDDPASQLSRRLEIVRTRLSEALDRAPVGPVKLISMCAGQGRDVIGVLGSHPRADDVSALLVELDERNVEYARATAAGAGLDQVEVVCADAGITDAYSGGAPAQIVLACGIFGNVSDESIRKTISTLPELCDGGATVIWTRHRIPPDKTPMIRDEFRASSFSELSFDAQDEIFPITVGVHRFDGTPRPLEGSTRMFAFNDQVTREHTGTAPDKT